MWDRGWKFGDNKGICHRDMKEVERKEVGVHNNSAELELKQHTMDNSAHPKYGIKKMD